MPRSKPSSWPFEERPWLMRRRLIKLEADKAEWDVPDTRVGGLIRQMRDRAHVAAARGRWLFALLFLVIILGLVYYIGLPIWQQFQDATKRALEGEIAGIDVQLSEMDEARDDAWANLTKSTRFAARRVTIPTRDASLRTVISTRNNSRVIRMFSDGVAQYSDDAGRTWKESQLPDFSGSESYFNLEVAEDQTRIFARSSSEISWANTLVNPTLPTWVSKNSGETWTRSKFPENTPENAVIETYLQIEDRKTLLIDGEIYSSSDFGATWARPNFGINTDKIVTLDYVFGGSIALEGSRRVHLSEDSFETWVTMELPQEVSDSNIEIFEASLEQGYVQISAQMNRNGRDPAPTIFYATTDAGQSWITQLDSDGNPTQVEYPIDFPLVEVVEVQENAVVRFGERAFDLRLDRYGVVVTESGQQDIIKARFPTFNINFETSLWTDNTQTALFGFVDGNDRPAFAGTSDAGETWFEYSVGSDLLAEFGDFGDFGDFGEGGAIDSQSLAVLFLPNEGDAIRVDDLYYQKLASVIGQPGEAGDNAMSDKLAEILADLPNDLAFQKSIEAFEDTIKDRQAKLTDRADKKAEADQIAGTGFSFSQRQRDYLAFLKSCQEQAIETECSTAYFDLRKAEAASIWQFIAERAPPAVLLLFLLATLGGLYRYNMRLTGFHNSRADALELLHEMHGDTLKLSKDEAAAFSSLVDQIAADKVEFGKSASPTDQAIELARAITQKA